MNLIQNKKIAITGAAGFLGYHLTHFFNQKEAKLNLIDIADFPKHEYEGPFNFFKTDIRNLESLNAAISGCDFVIHAAAALPLSSKSDIYSTNIDGTRNVLEAAKNNKIKRVIYISSTAVYGVPNKHPINESDPRIGVGPYGESKIAAENHCFSYINDGLGVTIIRPKTFVGTGRLGVFEILFDWIHDGKRIPVIGSGKNRYQLLEVGDLVEAIARTIEVDNNSLNEAYNIGAESFMTVAEDLEAVFKYAKSGSKILATPGWPIKKTLYIFEKLGLSPLYQWVYETADRDSFVSIEKLKKAIGWKPKYSNGEALIHAYDWYLKHYKEVKSRTTGTTHTVGWKQGILGFFKKMM